jgi:hypothetical protein
MSARLIDEASIVLPLLGRNLGAEIIAADPELSPQLQTSLQNFVRAISLSPRG